MVRLIVEKEGPVWVVKFHNPPHGYMDGVTASELNAFLDEVEASDRVRVVILTGSQPGVFIRHYDVAELVSTGAALSEKQVVFSEDTPVPESEVHTCLRRIGEIPVPFIAAVNGIAMGGGFETALACDLRLVEDGDYKLGLPEVKVGILPGAGGTQRLTRLIGQARAMEMILLAKTISPRVMYEYGLALECVQGDVLARAGEIADTLEGYSSLAVAHIKRLVRGVPDGSVEEGLALERTLFCDLMVSPEGLEAMRGMVESGGEITD